MPQVLRPELMQSGPEQQSRQLPGVQLVQAPFTHEMPASQGWHRSPALPQRLESFLTR